MSNLVMLIALTGGTILFVSWRYGERTVDDLSQLLIERTTGRISAELSDFFGEVRSQVLVGKGWAERDLPDASDYQALNAIFVPILEQHPQISSMMVADSDGVEYLLLRDALHPNVWHNRVVRADEWGTRVLNRRWDTQTGKIEQDFGELDYDPRRRVWYKEALKSTEDNPVFWTAPVIFFITKDPGITASTHVSHPGDKSGGPKTIVVAFDLLLLDISRFTTQLEVSKNGRAFVLVERAGDSDLRVVGLPRDQRFNTDTALREALMFVPAESAVADSEARLPTLEEINMPALEASLASWRREDQPQEPFRYENNGEAWLARLKPYRVGSNTFWIGVTLPERDLLGEIRAQRIVLLLLLLLVLVIGVLRARALARRFSNPIEELVHETERMSMGNLESISMVKTNVEEFRRLAEAQLEMLDGLRARMKLEKIEFDLDIARNIQRDLLPTRSPETPGFVIEGWSKPADQTGGDFFDWMALPDHRTLIMLGDVTGHGIGPALIASATRAYIRAAAMDEQIGLPDVMSHANDLLCADISDELFVTAAVAQLDPNSSTLTMISAGQAPLFFYHDADATVDILGADKFPLGINSGIEFDAPRRLEFEPGDTLVLTTDGFFEWFNHEGDLFGSKRLAAFVSANASLSPRRLIESLYAAVVKHAAGTRQPDDLTIVVIKRIKAEETDR